MKLGPVFASLLGVGVATFVPSRARAAETRAWTNLDDARACEPLDAGAFAVATGGGLALVAADGSVRALTSLDGLPDTRVHAVAHEGDSLWVGTESGVALVSIKPTLSVRRSWSSPDWPVHAVASTPSGIYLGTWGGGLWRVGSAQSEAERVASDVAGTKVSAITLHAGSLYVAYADGPVGRLDAGVVRKVTEEPTHGQALASIDLGDGPTLLLGDLEGLFRIRGTATPMASVDARALASVGPRLLVGTYGSGLLTATARGALRREDGVPKWVRGIGAHGSMQCVATSEGIFVREAASVWTKRALGGPPSNDVTALAVWGARVALGTFDAGAVIAERRTAESEPIAEPRALQRVPGVEPSETVHAVAWQGKGAVEAATGEDASRLLLGTARGFVRVEPDGSARRFGVADGLPSPIVRAVLVLDEDRVVVGTDDGPVILDKDHITPLVEVTKGAPRTLASPMRATWALAKRDDGTLYIGTTAGLYYGSRGQFRRAALATGELVDDWVTSLAAFGADVFVGTYSGGVTRLRIDGDHVAVKPLGGGYINPGGLTVSQGFLYAATMEGLLVRPLEDERAPWQRRSELSPGRDVTAALVVGGRCWIASRRGIGMSRCP